MPSEPDNLKAYSEACNTLRHYSGASLTVRLASVVQGVGILVAWAYAMSQKISALMVLFPFAGLIFTALLYRFHLGYFRATGFFYDTITKMEARLFDDEFRPMTAFHNEHAELYRTFFSRFFTLNAPFALVSTLFVFAIFTTLWVLKFGQR